MRDCSDSEKAGHEEISACLILPQFSEHKMMICGGHGVDYDGGRMHGVCDATNADCRLFMAVVAMTKLRYPLFAIVIGMMFLGGWAALQRAGWTLPMLRPPLVGMHGALMIGGVFGALISLERAVAISSLTRQPRHWSFLAPILAGLGGVLLIWEGPSLAARLCLAGASLLLTAVYIYTATKRHYWSLHTVIMTAGAALWLVGNLGWAAGSPIPVIVHTWMGFIVLTIVGERLELSRVTRLSAQTQRLLIGAVAVYGAGALLALVDLAVGSRAVGVGAVLVALWLLRYDIAGRRLGHPGLTGYIAVCLVVGYVWLAISGVLAVLFGPVYAGFQYDAVIHALVGGFIFSMVFGHAPLILPALTGRQIAFTPGFFLPLALLHLSIALREISSLSASFEGRMWASAINAAAVILFALLLISGARRAQANAT